MKAFFCVTQSENSAAGGYSSQSVSVRREVEFTWFLTLVTLRFSLQSKAEGREEEEEVLDDDLYG